MKKSEIIKFWLAWMMINLLGFYIGWKIGDYVLGR